MANEPRLIDAEQLKRYLRRVKLYTIKIDHMHWNSGYLFDDVFGAIDSQPTAEAAPRLACWRRIPGDWANGYKPKFSCSNCGESNRHFRPNFCPNCGADMRQEG